ncbi:Bacterial regulatory helix-turn-helix protein, lysR family [anaerobic digester metagenome]
MSMKTPTVRMHLWLESGESVYFGMGRLMLLDMIEEHGSLRKAAEAMGMSYRAAWGKLRATEDALGVVLVESSGTRRGGCHLTQAGKRFRDRFRAWFTAVEKVAVDQAQCIFAEKMQSFEEKKRTAVRPARLAAELRPGM